MENGTSAVGGDSALRVAYDKLRPASPIVPCCPIFCYDPTGGVSAKRRSQIIYTKIVARQATSKKAIVVGGLSAGINSGHFLHRQEFIIMSQGKFWILTIPENDFIKPTELANELCFIKGQLEQGDAGFRHWQIVTGFKKKIRLNGVKAIFGNTAHCELSRSAAANAYVCKDETSLGQRFELGELPINRNNKADWEEVWSMAKRGAVEQIPADIRIRSYSTLKRIKKDYDVAPYRPDISVSVYWGITGSGKSHRAFEEAEASGSFYVKGPTTKWWDSYRGEKTVIIDEFRGVIGIEHLLKWLDKYPCYVEEKGGQLPLQATKFIICSNLDPRQWYSTVDLATQDALRRRFTTCLEFAFPYNVPMIENVEPEPPMPEEPDLFLDWLNNNF